MPGWVGGLPVLRPPHRLAVAAFSLLLCAGLWMQPEPASAGACATIQRFLPAFAAAATARIPSHGGVLIYPQVGQTDTPRRPERPRLLDADAVLLQRAGHPVSAARVTLAPGWMAVTPAARPRGPLRFSLGDLHRSVRFASAAAAVLSPPRVAVSLSGPAASWVEAWPPRSSSSTSSGRRLPRSRSAFTDRVRASRRSPC